MRTESRRWDWLAWLRPGRNSRHQDDFHRSSMQIDLVTVNPQHSPIETEKLGTSSIDNNGRHNALI